MAEQDIYPLPYAPPGARGKSSKHIRNAILCGAIPVGAGTVVVFAILYIRFFSNPGLLGLPLMYGMAAFGLLILLVGFFCLVGGLGEIAAYVQERKRELGALNNRDWLRVTLVLLLFGANIAAAWFCVMNFPSLLFN